MPRRPVYDASVEPRPPISIANGERRDPTRAKIRTQSLGRAAGELAERGEHAFQNALAIVVAGTFLAHDLDQALSDRGAHGLALDQPVAADWGAGNAPPAAKNGAGTTATSGVGQHVHP